jgi:hypothetical protein
MTGSPQQIMDSTMQKAEDSSCEDPPPRVNMAPADPPGAKCSHGVCFIPVMARLAGNKRALRWQCLHPYCIRPLQASLCNLKRHVSTQHHHSYKRFLEDGATVPLPVNWKASLQGDLCVGQETGVTPARGAPQISTPHTAQHASHQAPQHAQPFQYTPHTGHTETSDVEAMESEPAPLPDTEDFAAGLMVCITHAPNAMHT